MNDACKMLFNVIKVFYYRKCFKKCVTTTFIFNISTIRTFFNFYRNKRLLTYQILDIYSRIDKFTFFISSCLCKKLFSKFFLFILLLFLLFFLMLSITFIAFFLITSIHDFKKVEIMSLMFQLSWFHIRLKVSPIASFHDLSY